jgi:hypothetical protein
MPTGIDAHTTAHGVKMELMKSTVVATALANGQMLGLGNTTRWSARRRSRW